MVMPARVADARVADVLCGEGAVRCSWDAAACVAPKRSCASNFWSVLFTPGLKKKTARLPLLRPFVRTMAYSTRLCDVYT